LHNITKVQDENANRIIICFESRSEGGKLATLCLKRFAAHQRRVSPYFTQTLKHCKNLGMPMETVRRQRFTKAMLMNATMLRHRVMLRPGVCGSHGVLACPHEPALAQQRHQLLTLSRFLGAVSSNCLSATLAPSLSSASTLHRAALMVLLHVACDIQHTLCST